MGVPVEAPPTISPIKRDHKAKITNHGIIRVPEMKQCWCEWRCGVCRCRMLILVAAPLFDRYTNSTEVLGQPRVLGGTAGFSVWINALLMRKVGEFVPYAQAQH